MYSIYRATDEYSRKVAVLERFYFVSWHISWLRLRPFLVQWR